MYEAIKSLALQTGQPEWAAGLGAGMMMTVVGALASRVLWLMMAGMFAVRTIKTAGLFADRVLGLLGDGSLWALGSNDTITCKEVKVKPIRWGARDIRLGDRSQLRDVCWADRRRIWRRAKVVLRDLQRQAEERRLRALADQVPVPSQDKYGAEAEVKDRHKHVPKVLEDVKLRTAEVGGHDQVPAEQSWEDRYAQVVAQQRRLQAEMEQLQSQAQRWNGAAESQRGVKQPCTTKTRG